jgi:hypothetical protein
MAMKSSILGHYLDSSPPIYYYQAFGLTSAKALACPELWPAEGLTDVLRRYGAVAERPAGSTNIATCAEDGK